ncbi:transcriptional regulator, partial [Staphylococcus pseudintermedius]
MAVTRVKDCFELLSMVTNAGRLKSVSKK